MNDPSTTVMDTTKLAKQESVTNPTSQVWVSANAGSGKTYVLSRRVIRLLLDGVPPSELLCLTFTKAAAAEMTNRVFEILGEWVSLDDSDLKEAITEATGKAPNSDHILRSRKLFALALDTPGGLKIQTIHAFCEALLHQFPLEANISVHFDLLDDIEKEDLLKHAIRNVTLASLGLSNSPKSNSQKSFDISHSLNRAFSIIREHASDTAIDKAIGHIINDREKFSRWLSNQSIAEAMSPTWDYFGLKRETKISDLYAEFDKDNTYTKSDYSHLAALLGAKGGAIANELLILIQAFCETTNSIERHQLRCKIFLTKKREPKANIVSKSFTDDMELRENFEDEKSRLLTQLDILKTYETLKASESLFEIAQAILDENQHLKNRNNVLDYSDLIENAANLLNRNEISAWIHYKLDRGITHVLVDEAQDTSPLQWQIINAITEEFFAGKGSSTKTRTLFVVGDEKQSIFSFQGADPHEFHRQEKALKKRSEHADLAFNRVELKLSFRSTQEILSAVDQVFSIAKNNEGLGNLAAGPVHDAVRSNIRGDVSIWPLEIKPNTVPRTDWRAPIDQQTSLDAEVVLAKKIASTISGWINTKEKLPGFDRPIRYGDILILLRKRDRFATAISRELKQADLVSAGADRLKLTEHIAIEDMLALGRFVCTNSDDLSLAALLKSPLFNFSEEELMAVCVERENYSLFKHMHSFESPSFVEDKSKLENKVAIAIVMLESMIHHAQNNPVFEFYALIFSKYEIQKRYQQRLGNEVEEVLNGFFQQALKFDNTSGSSFSGIGLQGFIEALSNSNIELKRQVDMQTNEIRVITAHSSKGLEAPIVFLVDPGSKAFTTNHAPSIISIPGKADKELMLWQSKTEFRTKATASAYEKIQSDAEDEYRRLLYVGMTRASDSLIVCGYASKKEPGYDHWHSMVLDGLQAEPENTRINGKLLEDLDENGELIQHRWVIDRPDAKDKSLADVVEPQEDQSHDLPVWLKKIKSPAAPPRPLSPSGVLQLLDIKPSEGPSLFNNDSSALNRGTAIHALLQILPDIHEEKQESTIERYFEISKSEFSTEQKSEIAETITKLINDPDLHILFSCEGRAELDLSGKIKIRGRTHTVRGQIDRLVFKDHRAIIIDYKSNINVPEKIDQVSQEYLAQLALYSHLVKGVFPDHDIEALLVWTQNAKVMNIPKTLLDRQMEILNNS